MSSSRHGGFFQAFSDLQRLPRAFWYVVGAFTVDAIAYFGTLTLMTVYLTNDFGWTDSEASITVSFFTMSVTLFMLGAGSYAESFGLKRAIVFALLLGVMGRIAYAWAVGLDAGPIAAAAVILGSLVVVALCEAILQPVCYSGVKQYTDERTSAMGYGLIYALMNFCMVIAGGMSSWIRPGVERIRNSGSDGSIGDQPLEPLARRCGSGVQAMNWVMMGVTALTLVGFAVLMTRRAEAAKVRPDSAQEIRKANKAPIKDRLYAYFAEGPFTNSRFLFFIFMLLPVRTLFAHQWLTMPQYILRAYSQDVGDRMEWLILWINPLIIFVGVPIATALTRQVHVYRMMILGALVSAVPTYLLCVEANVWLLIAYFAIFSVGEAMWSARFLEYASELAPEGRIAQYMGLASVPWLLAKGTTGLYSGWMLSRFCPEGTPREMLRTGMMWLIYGCIAMASPIGLWLARKWVMAGMATKSGGASSGTRS